MAHSSWFIYESMNRIMKNCKRALISVFLCNWLTIFLHSVWSDKFAVSSGNETQVFSGYPGMLSSWDDFYILGSQMVMLQTTNPVFNTSLRFNYAAVCARMTTSDVLLPFHHPSFSCLAFPDMATCQIGKRAGLKRLAVEHSVCIQQLRSVFAHTARCALPCLPLQPLLALIGTYNNQYMVEDMKLFSPGQLLKARIRVVATKIHPSYIHTTAGWSSYGRGANPRTCRVWR